MSEDKSTIEKTLAPSQFSVFDSHSHPGLEKKGIKDRGDAWISGAGTAW